MPGKSHAVVADKCCLTCGARLNGSYCHACGEKFFDQHSLSTSHLFHDVFHELSHLDSKIFRTLKALVTKPGLLTQQYWAGKLGLWFRPLRLYIILSALQYLLGSNTLGPLGVHFTLIEDPKKPGEAALSVGTLYNGYQTAEQYKEVAHKIYATYGALRWVGLFGFAAISWLLYKKRQHYFGAHLIAALHFFSAQYLISTAFSFISKAAGRPVEGSMIGALYLFFMLRRLYGESIGKAAGKTFLIHTGSFFVEVSMIASIGGMLLKQMKH